MKPKNFPERVNQRRKEALARQPDKTPLLLGKGDERELLQKKIVVRSLRDVRTKKQRGEGHKYLISYPKGRS